MKTINFTSTLCAALVAIPSLQQILSQLRTASWVLLVLALGLAWPLERS